MTSQMMSEKGSCEILARAGWQRRSASPWCREPAEQSDLGGPMGTTDCRAPCGESTRSRVAVLRPPRHPGPNTRRAAMDVLSPACPPLR